MPTAIAIFNDSSSLQRALDDLHSSGIASDRIRVVEGAERGAQGASADEAVGEDGITGRGALPGGTPMATSVGVGPYVAPGSSSGTPMPAAVADSLGDSLSGFDVDGDEARYFGDSLDEDSHLLAVKVTGDEDAKRVYDIFRTAGANRSNEPGR
jgi:hypothetical protein